MIADIPLGQFIGGLVSAIFWLFVAVWLFYFWPRSVRTRIARHELSESEGEAKIKNTSILGYIFIAVAVADAITTLSQAGYFGDSAAPLVVLGLTVCFCLFLMMKRWKNAGPPVIPNRPGTPPHKNKRFWLLVAACAVMGVAYPLTTRPHGGLVALTVISSVMTFLALVSIAWFTFRRVQRGQSPFSLTTVLIIPIVLVIFATIAGLILAAFSQKHP
jgi:hypothetical protein